MLEIVQKPYGKAFEEYAANKKEILCLTSDLTSSCEVNLFRDKYPDQYISLGMAEQNLMSFSAGLAMEGYRPFLHTFGVFLYRRPFEQLVCSVAYSNRKVRLMSFLPGITTPGGMTHQAIEDIAVLRSIPNMTILETGDATEAETVLEVADAVDGPVYVRILRGNVPRLFPKNEPFQFNKLRKLSNGEDLLIVSSGICTEEAMRAVAALTQKGISVKHLHVSTLKPFDKNGFLDEIKNTKGIITLENHTVIGGLGSIIAEVLAEEGVGIKLQRLGLQDTFAHGASKKYLMEEYGLDAMAVIKSAEKLLDIQTYIKRNDLSEMRIENVHSQAKAEGL